MTYLLLYIRTLTEQQRSQRHASMALHCEHCSRCTLLQLLASSRKLRAQGIRCLCLTGWTTQTLYRMGGWGQRGNGGLRRTCVSAPPPPYKLPSQPPVLHAAAWSLLLPLVHSACSQEGQSRVAAESIRQHTMTAGFLHWTADQGQVAIGEAHVRGQLTSFPLSHHRSTQSRPPSLSPQVHSNPPSPPLPPRVHSNPPSAPWVHITPFPLSHHRSTHPLPPWVHSKPPSPSPTTGPFKPPLPPLSPRVHSTPPSPSRTMSPHNPLPPLSPQVHSPSPTVGPLNPPFPLANHRFTQLPLPPLRTQVHTTPPFPLSHHESTHHPLPSRPPRVDSTPPFPSPTTGQHNPALPLSHRRSTQPPPPPLPPRIHSTPSPFPSPTTRPLPLTPLPPRVQLTPPSPPPTTGPVGIVCCLSLSLLFATCMEAHLCMSSLPRSWADWSSSV